MKYFIASDSYKGCLTSSEANKIIEDAIKAVNPENEVVRFSVADGGEGTSQAFLEACGGVMVHCVVRDAYFHNVNAEYALIDEGKTAVIEIASCIALGAYARERRKPMYATSYGVGQMMLDAAQKGVRKIILGLGGSATNDGGMGLLQALGVKFYDKDKNYLKSNANSLSLVDTIQFGGFDRLEDIEIIAACDVENTLLGKQGATLTFGKQKGLHANQMKKIEKAMQHYSDVFATYGYTLDNISGGGAAGGLGSVVQALLGAKQHSGLQLLIACTKMNEVIQDCDIVITGEGQSDKQTLYGKTPVGILNLAKQANKPCVCISGALGVEYKKLYDLGFVGIFSIADRAMSFAEALRLAPEKLYNATYTIVRTIEHFNKESL